MKKVLVNLAISIWFVAIVNFGLFVISLTGFNKYDFDVTLFVLSSIFLAVILTIWESIK